MAELLAKYGVDPEEFGLWTHLLAAPLRNRNGINHLKEAHNFVKDKVVKLYKTVHNIKPEDTLSTDDMGELIKGITDRLAATEDEANTKKDDPATFEGMSEDEKKKELKKINTINRTVIPVT